MNTNELLLENQRLKRMLETVTRALREAQDALDAERCVHDIDRRRLERAERTMTGGDVDGE